jgi:hypothetical protein
VARNDEIRVKLIGDERDLERAFQASVAGGEKLGDALKRTGVDVQRVMQVAEGDVKGLGAAFVDAGDLAKTALQAGVGAGTAMVGQSLNDATVAGGKLEAQIGSLGGASEQVGAVAKDVYTNNFAGSLGEAYEMTGQVNQALGLQGEELQAVTQDIFTITDAFGHQGAEAQAMVDVLRTMGPAFPGETEEQLLDRIAGSFQAGVGVSGDLLDTLKEYPGDFQRLGLDADDMFQILNSGFEAGVYNTDKTADAIREFGIEIQTTGGKAQEAVRQIFPDQEADRIIGQFAKGGDSAEKAFYRVLTALTQVDDAQTRTNLAFALFGSMGEDMGARLLPWIESMVKGRDTAKEVRDVTAEMQVQYENFGSTLEGFKRRIEIGLTGPLGATSDVMGGMLDVAGNAGEVLGAVALAGFDVAGAASRARTAIAGMNITLAGTATLAAAAAAPIAVLVAGIYGMNQRLADTHERAAAAVDPMASLRDNAAALYAEINANTGVNMADIIGPESEQRLKALGNELNALIETSPQLAQELLQLAVREGDVYETATGAFKGHTLFRDELILTKAQADALKENVKKLSGAEGANAEATAAAEEVMGTLGGQMADTRTEAQKLRDALDKLTGKTLTAEQAEIDFERAIDDATQAAKDNKQSLDKNTEAGRTNRESLKNLTERTLDFIVAQKDNKKSTDTLRDTMERGRKKFIETAMEMGATRKRAEELADKYGLIPKKVETLVRAPGLDKTKKDVGALNNALRGLPNVARIEFKSSGLDGLGVLGGLGAFGGGLMGISPLSTVGKAYSSLGRPGDVISGYRPGATTLSGNLSYHAQGRALDITPEFGIALAIRNLFGGRTRELITPWPSMNMHNGRDYRYSDAVQAQHDGRTNVRHIHWAMGQGGLVNRRGSFLVGDSGMEIVNLARGDSVTPLDRAPRVGGTTVVNNFNFTFNGMVTDKVRLKHELVAVMREFLRANGGVAALGRVR